MVDRESLKSQCRSCGAEIFWATTTTSGKRNPIDADPVVGGNLFLFAHRDGGMDVYLEAVHAASGSERAAGARGRGQRRYVSHFSTCPNSEQHRRR